jgi:hypothetical protein
MRRTSIREINGNFTLAANQVLSQYDNKYYKSICTFVLHINRTKSYYLLVYTSIFLISILAGRLILCSEGSTRIHYTNLQGPTKSQTKLKVISYNTAMILRSGWDAARKAKVIADYIDKFDIVLLQEFFWNPISNGWGIGKILDEKGFDVTIAPSASFFGIEWINSGLLVATRRATVGGVKSCGYHPFEEATSIDVWASKGYQYLTMESGLVIVNTHAQADYNPNEFPYDGSHVETRKLQLAQIAETVRVSTGADFIVGGDFNFADSGEAVEFRRETGLRNFVLNGVDAIFSSFLLSGRETHDVDSDHLTLEATILLN